MIHVHDEHGIKLSTKIAVIDDDDGFRLSLVRLLQAAGFDPVEYSSAEEFLEDKNRTDVQCLVLDVYLGGMTGFELQKKLAASDSTTPIIFVSGHEKSDIPELKKETGSASFFTKPVQGKALLKAIQQAVELNKNNTE